MIAMHNLKISPRIHLHKLLSSNIVKFRTSIFVSIGLNIIQRLELRKYISVGKLSKLRELRSFMDLPHIYIFMFTVKKLSCIIKALRNMVKTSSSTKSSINKLSQIPH